MLTKIKVGIESNVIWYKAMLHEIVRNVKID